MKVEFDTDEVWEVFSLVVSELAGEAKLADADRAKIRRWRSEVMKPSGDAVRAFTAKFNETLAETMNRNVASKIRKPDWR